MRLWRILREQKRPMHAKSFRYFTENSVYKDIHNQEWTFIGVDEQKALFENRQNKTLLWLSLPNTQRMFNLSIKGYFIALKGELYGKPKNKK